MRARHLWGLSLCGMASLLALSACKQEASFDERFDKADEALQERAQSIDEEIADKRAAACRANAESGAAEKELSCPADPASDTPAQPKSGKSKPGKPASAT
ncbi:hypothetical protein [Altericroceibacterium endophyticum]|uniref:EexN family lipoprotein n=1 Tax=Altericroceibacterium endophyticum TaxID=1808508 RepID=A0A6I4TBC0_9SPHN|nr:hypothetical protein [Altericroceibacterium endophyticum]MXO67170.1 hypothetical protein [Altericroceibacterium endophyticum]